MLLVKIIVQNRGGRDSAFRWAEAPPEIVSYCQAWGVTTGAPAPEEVLAGVEFVDRRGSTPGLIEVLLPYGCGWTEGRLVRRGIKNPRWEWQKKQDENFTRLTPPYCGGV